MTSPDVFFIVSKFWFSGLLGAWGCVGWGWVVRGGNRAENSPKWQKILSHSVSQELYLIGVCFLVHMCKMMISPAIFFISSKVWFFGFFKVHQWMAKGNSEVCPTFTCVWFLHLEITLPFAKFCFAFEEKLFFSVTIILLKKVILSCLKMNLKISHKLR